ncbi:MAG: hypothetical protein JOZ70_14570 [Pseudolabrys sp.]|nr:hypothetical protein [Pseudolabrys sp.]MBV9956459.1 hypothetical protein [Pseudolabrys sp.]
MEAALTYLYTLASLAVTFGSFAVIAVALRQEIGGSLGKTHLFITRVFIELAILVAVLSILPGFLALIKLQEEHLWRFASVIAAFLILIWSISYPIRRHKAVRAGRFALVVWVNSGLNATAFCSLAVNIVSISDASGAFYAAAPTIMMLRLWGNFLHNLDTFVRRK